MKYLSTKGAAQELGICDSRVRHLILTGRLKAEKLGHDGLILPKDLNAVRVRKTGRPRRRKE